MTARFSRPVSLVLALAAGAVAVGGGGPTVAATTKPNIIVFMTDDQALSDMWVMKRTNALLGERGVTFTNAFASYPLCCPARASFLTGQYAHNHGVASNHAPDGGFQALDSDHTLPVWLQAAGYRTIFAGKYLNGYGRRKPRLVPPGWDEFYGLVASSAFLMWGFTLNQNGKLKTYGEPTEDTPRLYQTEILRRRALDAIWRHSGEGRPPIFMWLSFLAPHNESSVKELPRDRTPRAAPRDRGTFRRLALPRGPAFDEEDVDDKPAHIRRRGRLDDELERAATLRYRARLESLLAVDRMVASIVRRLDELDMLENTVLLFTSDNGYVMGDHRIPWAKYVPYEASVRVPLLISGPDLPRGVRSRELVANIDIAPTILQLAGAEPSLVVDGRSMLPYARDPALRTSRPILLQALESAKSDEPEPEYPGGWQLTRRQPRFELGAPPYQAIRTRRHLYVEYRSGDRELYDLAEDPHLLRNVAGRPAYRPTERDLRLQLAQLSSCVGLSCRQRLSDARWPQ